MKSSRWEVAVDVNGKPSGVRTTHEYDVIVVARVWFFAGHWKKTYQYFKVLNSGEVMNDYRALYDFSTLDNAMVGEDESWKELGLWTQ